MHRRRLAHGVPDKRARHSLPRAEGETYTPLSPRRELPGACPPVVRSGAFEQFHRLSRGTTALR